MAILHEQTVDNTLGAAFLGVVGSSILFGVTTLQAYIYYHHYPRDTMLHKVAVGLLWALDLFHLALIIHAVYHYMVTGWGRSEGIEDIVWSIKLQVLINVVIILIVQSLYAFRVWLLGGYHNGVLGYLPASVVAGGFAIGIVFVYFLYTAHTFKDLDSISWAIDSSLAASTAIDFTISFAMCWYLRKSGTRLKGMRVTRLNSRISNVMQYSLSSGLITSACSLSTLFTYTLMPDNLIYLGLQFLLTKLYVGSYLAMLNAREPRPHGHQEHQSPLHSPNSASSFSLPSFGMPLSPVSPTESTSNMSLASPVSISSPRKLKQTRYPWEVENPRHSQLGPIAIPPQIGPVPTGPLPRVPPPMQALQTGHSVRSGHAGHTHHTNLSGHTVHSGLTGQTGYESTTTLFTEYTPRSSRRPRSSVGVAF